MNTYLINPDNYKLTDGYTNVITQWGDKGDSVSASLSFVLRGLSCGGTLTVEISNAPEAPGTTGNPGNADDAITVPGSSQSVAAPGNFIWDITTAARWVRVKYIASAPGVDLTVSSYLNSPEEK